MKSNRAGKDAQSAVSGGISGAQGKPSGAVRVIGGQWRSRRIDVAEADGLRPTGDRIRETLFNWLGTTLTGTHCLDLFAGTGILGIEALSRGAAQVDWVEKNLSVARQLKTQLASFQESDPVAGRGVVHHADALAFLRRNRSMYDLVFLDPPFARPVWPALWPLLGPCVSHDGRVYVEAPAQPDMLSPPPRGWHIIRQSQAGAVWFALLRCEYSQTSPTTPADLSTP